MKRILFAALVCMMLCGCGTAVSETTAPAQLQVTVSPTEIPGSYVPGSAIELATNGAVRAYHQSLENIRGIRMMGEDLLVFSGSETTTLTRLSGENLYCASQIKLDCFLPTQAPSLTVHENLLAYFDTRTRDLVCFNQELEERSRIPIPEDLLGEPMLTADLTKIYYCTSSGIRCLETQTGISRLVKEMTFAEQYLTDMLFADSVLRVETFDAVGNRETLFLDAQTGALIGGLPEDITLCGDRNFFYAMDPEGIVNQMIYGSRESVGLLTPKHYLDSGEFLPEAHAAVVHTREGTLDYYNLHSGKQVASLILGDLQPESMTASDNDYLYFLQDGTTICRWDLSVSLTGDETIYTGPKYTLDNPDADGMGKCRIYARQLGEEHGLEIRVGLEATDTQPFDYRLVPEYQVHVLLDALTQLDTMLDHYPEGFFADSVADMEGGKLTVCLVRGLIGSPESGSLEAVDGIQFWEENHAYIAIALGEPFGRTFYHEMFHVLETRVLSRSIAWYRWDELNPKGFAYDYDYIANQSRDGSAYLEDATRAFIDTYSMSFPKEDRARIMEYACMEGNESYFQSKTMQRKLRTLCEGIRESYGLEDYPETLLWEQYLEASLTLQK